MSQQLVQQLANDSDFMGLPDPEKVRVMAAKDSNFAGLDPGEQQRVVSMAFQAKPLTLADRARQHIAAQRAGTDFAPPAITAPPAPPPQGFTANALADALGAGRGSLKGMIETGTNIDKFATGAATGNFGPFDEPDTAAYISSGAHGGATVGPAGLSVGTKPVGGAENTGYYGEKLAEILAPAGLARRAAAGLAAGSNLILPSGRVLAEIPAVTSRLGRAALTAGTEAASNAGVTLAQTGDPKAAGWAGALSGVIAGPMQYISKAARAAKLIDGVFDPEIALPGLKAGADIQTKLAAVNKAAGEHLGAAYGAISNAADRAGARVGVDQALPGIKELLGELKDPTKVFPSLGGVDDVNHAISILGDFARPAEDVATGLLDASGNQIMRTVPREVSVGDALKLRALLFKLSNAGNTGIGKGSLKQLTMLWHGEIENALSKADPALAQQFNAASGEYRQFITTFKNKTIQRLVKEAAPEKILDALMSDAGETTAQKLKSLIGTDNMEIVRASLWKRLLQKASPADGTFLAPQFEKAIDKLSLEAQKAVFGSEQAVAKMRQFAQLMDSSWIHNAAQTSISKAAIRGVTGGIVGTALGFEGNRLMGHDGAGHLYLWAPTGAAMAIAPTVVARILAKPDGVDVVSRALQTSPKSTMAKAIISRLTALAGGQLVAKSDISEPPAPMELSPSP